MRPPVGAYVASEVLRPANTISCVHSHGKVYISDKSAWVEGSGICRSDYLMMKLTCVSLPSFGGGLDQRSAANRRPIDRVHGRRESRLDLFDRLPFPE
jgi:hypothetical protein